MLEPGLEPLGPCVGGNWSHADTGCGADGGECLRRGSYCRPGHEGPLCVSCVKDGTNHLTHTHTQTLTLARTLNLAYLRP